MVLSYYCHGYSSWEAETEDYLNPFSNSSCNKKKKKKREIKKKNSWIHVVQDILLEAFLADNLPKKKKKVNNLVFFLHHLAQVKPPPV